MNIGISASKIVGMVGPALGGPVAAVLTANAGPGGMGALKGLMNNLGKLSGMFSKSQGLPASPSPRPAPFSPVHINVKITLNPGGMLQQPPTGRGPMQSFAKAPEVGNDSQWGALANAVNSRITGNDKSFNMNGTNPWAGGGDKADMAAVAWAMQKNDKVRFDSDRKQFYVTNGDGSTRDVASLDEVKGEIAKNGGASPSSGQAYNAVGNFLQKRISNAGTPSGQKAPANANPFQELMQMLEKLLKSLQGGKGASASASGGASSPASTTPASSSSTPATSSTGGGNPIDSMINKSGSKIDSMMGEAEKLMSSDKMADQLKGQRMMQQAMRLFEMISKMMEQRSQMQAKAIQAIK